MRIKIFRQEDDKELQKTKEEIFSIGLKRSEYSYTHNDAIKTFAALNLETIAPYWDTFDRRMAAEVIEAHFGDFKKMVKGEYTHPADPQNLEDSSIYQTMMQLGMEKIFFLAYEEDKALAVLLASHYPEIIEKYINSADQAIQRAMLSAVAEHSFYRLSDTFWVDYCKALVNSIISAENIYQFRDLQNVQGSLVLDAADILDETTGDSNFQWMDLYRQFEKSVDYYRYANDNISRAVKLTLAKATEEFMEYVGRTEFKSIHMSMRMVVYVEVIRAGLLEEKIARRIRSDSSERVSSAAIEQLFKSLDQYDKPDELVAQFFDTKYERVELELVSKSPDEYLPFLAGVKGSRAKYLLEEKMSKASEKVQETN